MELVASDALGIGAASFFCGDGDGGEVGAEKDIAESPTAIAGTPKIAMFFKNKNILNSY